MKAKLHIIPIIIALTSASCDAQDPKQPEKAPQTKAGSQPAEVKTKPADSDNGQSEFAKWYLTVRPNAAEDDILRGLSPFQFMVFLATPQAKEAFEKAGVDQQRLSIVLTKHLTEAGLKILDADGWPKVILSVETIDEGRGLAFYVRLSIMEQVAVFREGKFIKAAVQTWEAPYRGLTPYASAGTNMGNSVDAVIKKFVDAYHEKN